MKENDFIKIIKETLPESAKFIGDDTAFILEKDIVITQDTLIDGIHFRHLTISPFDLGVKSVAVNLSDIAAAGAIPEYITISLSMPENMDETFVREFYQGVRHICNKYEVLVIGGDLTKAFNTTISITAIGNMRGLKPASRSYAKEGDFVITTGEHGSSYAGFLFLEKSLHGDNGHGFENIKEDFIKAHVNPIPKVKEGRMIIEKSNDKVAMMDSSDGLADALYKISQESGVNIEIDYDKIPVNPNLKQALENDIFDGVFFGGEDYQLVACVSKDCYEKIKDKFYLIGKVISKSTMPEVLIKKNDELIRLNEKLISEKIFKHFE